MGEEHNDPYLPFQVPVGPALRFGEENLIAIRVDNFRGRTTSRATWVGGISGESCAR